MWMQRDRVTAAGIGAAGVRATTGPAVVAPPAVASEPAVHPEPDLAATIEPMLAAVVRMTGASAGTVRLVGRDGTAGAPLAVAGSVPAGSAPWCAACDEALELDSECVAQLVCGNAEVVVASAVTQVCRHVATVPLEHKGRVVGTLALNFAAPLRIAPELTPVLKAVGDLIGVALENARLAAENLRMSLTAERQLMANEVHDSLAQALTYMRMRMSLLSDAIRQGDELGAFKYWVDVDDSLTNAHRRLRELITCFRSAMDPQGLVHALDETAANFHDRTGVALKFDNRVPGLRLPAEREVEIFRIVQEALANVCRHAQARNVEVRLDRMAAGNGYEIVVVDDGVGLGVPADHDDTGHYGLAIMRERARRLGGTVTLESRRGAGTCVRLTIPATGAAIGNQP